jgi:hypothetical protein
MYMRKSSPAAAGMPSPAPKERCSASPANVSGFLINLSTSRKKLPLG